MRSQNYSCSGKSRTNRPCLRTYNFFFFNAESLALWRWTTYIHMKPCDCIYIYLFFFPFMFFFPLLISLKRSCQDQWKKWWKRERTYMMVIMFSCSKSYNRIHSNLLYLHTQFGKKKWWENWLSHSKLVTRIFDDDNHNDDVAKRALLVICCLGVHSFFLFVFHFYSVGYAYDMAILHSVWE